MGFIVIVSVRRLKVRHRNSPLRPINWNVPIRDKRVKATRLHAVCTYVPGVSKKYPLKNLANFSRTIERCEKILHAGYSFN